MLLLCSPPCDGIGQPTCEGRLFTNLECCGFGGKSRLMSHYDGFWTKCAKDCRSVIKSACAEFATSYGDNQFEDLWRKWKHFTEHVIGLARFFNIRAIKISIQFHSMGVMLRQLAELLSWFTWKLCLVGHFRNAEFINTPFYIYLSDYPVEISNTNHPHTHAQSS